MKSRPTRSPPTPAPSNRGKLVVLGIFGVGLVLAAFAWWWNFTQNRRAAALWGQPALRLIRQAPEVALWSLSDSAPMDENVVQRLSVGGQTYWITDQRNIGQARGLVHARYALTEDASFESISTKAVSSVEKPQWDFAVRFGQGNSQTTLVFDLKSNRVACLETGREAILLPRIMQGWERLVKRELE